MCEGVILPWHSPTSELRFRFLLARPRSSSWLSAQDIVMKLFQDFICRIILLVSYRLRPSSAWLLSFWQSLRVTRTKWSWAWSGTAPIFLKLCFERCCCFCRVAWIAIMLIILNIMQVLVRIYVCMHRWCMMYDVWCMMYDVWCMMYDV